MAPTKTLTAIHRSKTGPTKPSKMTSTIEGPHLLKEATYYLHTGFPETALDLAREDLRRSTAPPSTEDSLASLRSLTLLGEIYVELGSPEKARDVFRRAVALDPEGLIPESQGGGAEKFLWLAQLCDEGGTDSIHWFQRGAEVLRRQIVAFEDKGAGAGDDDEAEEITAKREKLGEALCGMIEVWMTDLS